MSIEYHWLDGAYLRLPAVLDDVIQRRVDVIAIPGNGPAVLAAKAATATIPIVFGVAENPVGLGLVKSLAQPEETPPELIFSHPRSMPSGSDSCMSCYPRLLVSLCWSIQPTFGTPRPLGRHGEAAQTLVYNSFS